MSTAVVFAYHDVGVRCLATLLAHGIDVKLVVTHQDNPAEEIWFASVAQLARDNDLAVITPSGANDPQLLPKLRAIAPDFIFSFYYRYMLAAELLATAGRGALNMHGSLLPKYRGRVPVNWAILNGERSTGASLHYMVAKPDAGDLIDQMAVPIHPDDDALAVFRKLTVAAELVLDRSLAALVQGNAPRRALDLAQGSYFGGRSAADGRIDWQRGARQVHDLVRAVAPPYPGAFTSLAGQPLRILQTRCDVIAVPGAPGAVTLRDARWHVSCGSGSVRILSAELGGAPVTFAQIANAAAGSGTLRLD